MARPFRFRLASVLRVRRVALEAHQRAVAERTEKILAAQQRLDRTARIMAEQTEAARATLQRALVPVAQALWDRQQLARLRRESIETANGLEQDRAALVHERRGLADALKAVRSLERLEEKEREAYRRGVERAERIEEDERTALRFGRSAGSASETA